MSFTVICFATALACLVLATGLGMASESLGWITGIPALLALAATAVSLIFGVASYNENIRADTDSQATVCTEEGNEVLRYNGADYCVKPGSQIIRII